MHALLADTMMDNYLFPLYRNYLSYSLHHAVWTTTKVNKLKAGMRAELIAVIRAIKQAKEKGLFYFPLS